MKYNILATYSLQTIGKKLIDRSISPPTLQFLYQFEMEYKESQRSNLNLMISTEYDTMALLKNLNLSLRKFTTNLHTSWSCSEKGFGDNSSINKQNHGKHQY